MPAVLPDQLQSKLGQLAARDRRRRAVRGCFRLTSVIAIAGGLLLALDAWLTLPPIARSVLIAAAMCATFVSIWRWLIVPLRMVPDPASLAAAVEEQYPRLDERLSSSVELASVSDSAFGSPALIDMLIRETDQRTRAIDFDRAAPSRTPRLAIGILAAVTLSASIAVLLWPDWMAGLGRRLIHPWDNRLAVEPFAIAVTSNGDVVALGRRWSVRAELVPRQDGVALPDHCTLTITPDGGIPTRFRMQSDSNGTHSFALDKADRGFRFQVAAGPVETEEFAVAAVAAPNLTSLQLAVVPPAYTKLPPQQIDSPTDVTVSQFSRLRWTCRFDPSAQDVEVVESAGTNPERRVPMTLTDDHHVASMEQRADATATCRIVALGERGITTESPDVRLKNLPDQPPSFQQVLGLGELLHELGINDALRMQVVISDDFGVSAAEVQYRINDGPVQSTPMPLTGLGSHEARGTVVFPLAGRVQVGDQLRCRLRIADNRTIPELNLGPQVSYFPSEDQWCDWRIVEQSAPIREREAAAIRDAIDKTIRDLVGQLDRDRQALAAMSRDLTDGGKLTDGEQSKIQALQSANEQVRQSLEKLGQQADSHDMPTIGDAARSIANREMAQAVEFLRDAALGDSDRRKAVQQAEHATESARDRLERLRSDNQRLAQQRLDAEQIENLADKQKQLADKTSELQNPDDKDQTKQDQAGLAKDLDKLAQENQFAKDAIRAANAEEAQRLSDRAKALATAERELDRAIRDAERAQNSAQFTEASRIQKELSEEIDRLTKKMQRALKAAEASPPSSDGANQAAEMLRRGDADEARDHQRKTAAALEQLADRLQSALDARRDPQQAARQLSRLQSDTRRRTLDAARPDAPERDGLGEEERALLQAIEQLPIADSTIEARREQIDAAGKARQALTALSNGHMNTAADLMQQAREALDRLASSLPSIAERKKSAQSALDGIRKNQSQLQKKVQDAGKAPTKRPTTEETAALAKQQADLAEQIAKLDPPIAPEQRDSTRAAAGDALDDLMAGRWSDVASSQAELNRQLKRLDDALKGKLSIVDIVRDLARREHLLAETATKDSGQAEKIAALLTPQQKITTELLDLDIGEEVVRQAEAVAATQAAALALRDRAGEADTPRLLDGAAAKLDELATRLLKPESSRERAARLAGRQKELTESPSAAGPNQKQQQKQVQDELKALRAGDQAEDEKRQALDALSRLQDNNLNPQEQSAAVKNATDAIQRLADKLSPPTGSVPATAAELAQRQRDLAAETAGMPRQSGQARADALDQAAQRQRKLREQVNRLPSGTAPQSLQQARLAMAQAEQELRRDDSERAKQSQLKAAALLDAAARDVARRNNPSDPSGDLLPTQEQLQTTRDLAKQQRQLEQQVKSMSAKTQPPADATQRQDEIAEQTEELIKLLQQDISVPAADAARQAKDAMQNANEQQHSDSAEARQSRQRAATELDRAAAEAARKAESETRAGSPNAPPSAGGKALMKARGRMQAAQKSLDKDESDSASQNMKQAAQALQDAAQQLRGGGQQQQTQNGGSQSGADPNAGGPQGKQSLPLSPDVANELKLHAGKRWGELPGELKTRIMQDVQAQYGDDYARIIRLYFESLADRK
jgi:hypothetical protein